MPLLVTSAAGVNGDGYGALLAFDRNGRPLGAFSNDARISDPRGLAVDQRKELLFLNSGSDRVLALDRNGKVVRDTGPIPQLNPGGGTFGPDGRYYIGLRSARTIVPGIARYHRADCILIRFLGADDLETLDMLITAGIATSRAEGVRWALARIRERPAYEQLRARTREIEDLKSQF